MGKKPDEILKLIQTPEKDLQSFIRGQIDDADMETYFGKHAESVHLYASVDQSAAKKGDSLIIMIPGLTGSVLENVGEDPQVIWLNPLSFLQGHLNWLDLTEDGLSDATGGKKITAPRPLWLVYAKMILRLQNEYEVYSFPYDWRRAPSDHAGALKAFIDEKLAASKFEQVTLVGHSMGGLVLTHYLIGEQTKAHAEKKVKRAITLGTPFRGSIETVSGLAGVNDPKMVVATTVNKANDPARMLRSFPGMYSLLPAPANLYPDWNPLPELDIWKPETWQNAGMKINVKHLERAHKHHETLAAADPQVPLHTVIGTFYATPVQLLGAALAGNTRRVAAGLEGGDGTVEVASATFKKAPAYFVHEVHVELVLEEKVIENVMHWAEGGNPTGLVQNIDDVVLDDMPMRGGAPGPTAQENAEKMAAKISADDALDQADIQMLFRTSNK
jgi:pimeloyl-ACP methyl ester carboxylesterase